jgi:hypothetical protein
MKLRNKTNIEYKPIQNFKKLFFMSVVVITLKIEEIGLSEKFVNTQIRLHGAQHGKPLSTSSPPQ